MNADALEALRAKISERTDNHGTLMVIQKLASLYADDFDYEVRSEGSGRGCSVRISIPVL